MKTEHNTEEEYRLQISELIKENEQLKCNLKKHQEQEELISRQQAFLEGIYFGIETPIFVFDVLPDETFRFVGLNPAHEEWSGMKSEWIKGKSLEDLESAIPKEIIGEIRERYTRCLRAQKPIHYEEKLIIYGKDCWWKTTLTPLKDESGRIYRIIGSAMNVTELKEAQSEIEASRDKLESLVTERTEKLKQSQAIVNSFTEHLPGILVVIDKNHDLIFLDGQGLGVFNINKKELEHTKITDSVLGKLFPEDFIQKSFEGKEIITKKNLDGLHFEIFLHPVLDENDAVENIVGLAIDVTSVVKIAEERRLHEQDYKFLFDHMNEGFAIHEMLLDENKKPYDYQFLDINSAFSNMTGMQAKDVVGKSVRQIIPNIEDDPADWIGKYAKVAIGRQDITFEDYSAALKKWFRVHAFPGRDHQFGVTFSDVTEIKEQQDVIKEANEFNALILENSPLAKIALNEQGECIIANTKAATVLGLEEENIKLIDRSVLNAWGKDLLSKQIDMVLDVGNNSNAIVKIPGDSEKVNWYEVFISRFYAREKKHLLIQIADISDKVTAQTERDQFFNTTLTLFCTADFTGYFRQLNPAWQNLLGWETAQMLTTPFKDFLHPDDIAPTTEIIQKLKGGYRTTDFVNRYRTKDGSYKILKWDALAVDEILYCSATDITDLMVRENEIRKQKEELELVVKQLEISNKELQQFAYVASHDLQEPLRKIKNFSELLSQQYGEALDAKAQRYISYLVSGAMRLQMLINDLLTYSRITTQGQSFERVSMEAVLNAVIQNLSITIQESKAVIKNDPLPIINGDATQISQLLQNLIGNAIKYRKPDISPVIQINVMEQDKQYIFAVRDNGIGFDMEFSDRIFIVFQRLHTGGEYEGTGIGLALCKRIVECHGGKIWVESHPGKGSTFYFTLGSEN